MSVIRPALAVLVLFTALLGLAMPLAITGIAGVAAPGLAAGSMVERDGKLVGSSLIGQSFTEARYFHARPSATSAAPYDAASSAASQLGPTSAALLEKVTARVAEAGGRNVPADAAYASGSGLDPHISPAFAALQVGRVAQARGIPPERLRDLLATQTEQPFLGLIGEPRVNVLRLNLALDAFH